MDGTANWLMNEDCRWWYVIQTCDCEVLFVVRTSKSSKHGLVTAHSAECLLTSAKPSSSTDMVAELVQRTIDLAGCADASVEIHPLHGSVLGQQHCFQVSTRAGNTYFACRSDDESREWIEQYVILIVYCHFILQCGMLSVGIQPVENLQQSLSEPVWCRDYSCGSTTIRLWSDYNVSCAPASIRRHSTQAKNEHVNFRCSRIVVEFQLWYRLA